MYAISGYQCRGRMIVMLSLQSFACCKHQVLPLGAHLPFCVDLSRNTFEKLDMLLRLVCEGLDGVQGPYPPPHQDQECMATAVLNLLCLQVSQQMIWGYVLLCVLEIWGTRQMC